jgi:tRNA pseudouridine32 synthase/23S rRNA pseudouridine746 synthase
MVENADAFFHEFNTNALPLPKRLNNPFYVDVSNLGQAAFSHFKLNLLSRNAVEMHFKNGGVGKMFGLLVVKAAYNKIGYLAAFSGKINDTVEVEGFVRPVFDTLVYDGFYKKGERVLDGMTHEIEALIASDDYAALIKNIEVLKETHQGELMGLAAEIKQGKAKRKALRINASLALVQQLSQESIDEQLKLKWRKKEMQHEQTLLQNEIDAFEQQINALKQKRKKLSQQLQRKLFEQYTFLNAQKKEKNILQIFEAFGTEVPPAGTGECAAPKLFQFAFQHNLEPIELIEFWWGPSPPSRIRVQGNFYPSCRSKCEPILSHMLSATTSEPPPLLNDDDRLKEIVVLYEDNHLAVLNKPFDVLSVPGKVQSLSVQDYLPTLFPHAERPMLVHRLDRATSGILLVAMNHRIYVALQKQFMQRKIHKRYEALLDGEIVKQSGLIDLPLRVDLDNRPQQMVCYEHGLAAQTKFEVVERTYGKTRIHFFPITGRTHQLRVHAAHSKGLKTPIIGDDLYGVKDERLCLHAAEITFTHPFSMTETTISCDAPF